MLSVRHVCHEMVMHRHGITVGLEPPTSTLPPRVFTFVCSDPVTGRCQGQVSCGHLLGRGRQEVSHQFSPHTRDTLLILKYVVFRCRVMTPEVS
jgi:hypothetical protein